jgi:hypothetical protein
MPSQTVPRTHKDELVGGREVRETCQT